MRRSAARAGLGGPEGNELLTSVTAVVLTALLVTLAATIVHLHGLVGTHMFLGLALLPPVALKLASTGYRFVRYYTGAPAYTAKGPPQLPLRLLAPVLVAMTILVFATGVALLADERKVGWLLELHKVSFIVWGVVFGIHFLAYAPRVARAAAGGRRVPGATLRGVLIGAATGGGLALAIALLPAIDRWHA